MREDQVGYRNRRRVVQLPKRPANFSTGHCIKPLKPLSVAEQEAAAVDQQWKDFEASCRVCAELAFDMTKADRKKYLRRLELENAEAAHAVDAMLSAMYAERRRLPKPQVAAEQETIEEPSMSAGIDLGDSFQLPPQRPEASDMFIDAFDYDVAFKFAFVGVGQGGSRIAESFHGAGYRRVCAINTTGQDLSAIKLGGDRKLDLGGAGAGKDPDKGAAAIAGRSQDVRDLFSRSFGPDVDHIFVCFGAGGGTGAGAYAAVIVAASAYMAEIGRPVRVGVIMALPKDAEGARPAANALSCAQGLLTAQTMTPPVSPIIIVDNQKIQELYNPAVSQEYNTANGSITNMLHSFNRLAGAHSELVTFDREDFSTMLSGGLVSFANALLTSWDDRTTIAKSVRDNLDKNLLVSGSMLSGKAAALLFVLNGNTMDELPQAHLDYTVEMLNQSLKGERPTVFQGIYKGAEGTRKMPGSLYVLAMVAGLPWPQTRLHALARKAALPASSLEAFLS